MKIVKRMGERLPRWVAAEVGPVLAFTGAGSSLFAGSCILAGRGWTALGARFDKWERLGVLLFAGYLAVYSCTHAPQIARFAVPGALVAWCAAAWWVAPRTFRAAAPEQLLETAPELTLTELAELVRRVAAHRQGAHLADLLAESELVGWTQPELKATAADFGLPVEEFKLMLDGRQRVRDGIRVRDLPPAPAPATLGTLPPNGSASPAPQPLSAPAPRPK
jgi:hypothetical protein